MGQHNGYRTLFSGRQAPLAAAEPATAAEPPLLPASSDIPHYHVLLQAYKALGEGGALVDAVQLDLLAPRDFSEADLLSRAGRLLPGRLYRIAQVIEHHGHSTQPT